VLTFNVEQREAGFVFCILPTWELQEQFLVPKSEPQRLQYFRKSREGCFLGVLLSSSHDDVIDLDPTYTIGGVPNFSEDR
jgi:hypothetical protein